jgi:hypothetical protein
MLALSRLLAVTACQGHGLLALADQGAKRIEAVEEEVRFQLRLQGRQPALFELQPQRKVFGLDAAAIPFLRQRPLEQCDGIDEGKASEEQHEVNEGEHRRMAAKARGQFGERRALAQHVQDDEIGLVRHHEGERGGGQRQEEHRHPIEPMAELPEPGQQQGGERDPRQVQQGGVRQDGGKRGRVARGECVAVGGERLGEADPGPDQQAGQQQARPRGRRPLAGRALRNRLDG